MVAHGELQSRVGTSRLNGGNGALSPRHADRSSSRVAPRGSPSAMHSARCSMASAPSSRGVPRSD